MKNQRVCKCGSNRVIANESLFLKRYIEGELLFLKSTGGGDGIDDICCAECGEKIKGDFEIEFL